MKNNKLFRYMVLPYIIYCVVNIIFIILSVNNVGALNNDVGYGLFISWICMTFTELSFLVFKK